MIETIYWTVMESHGWKIHIAASTRGLVFVGTKDQSFMELHNWVSKHYPDCPLVRDEKPLTPYVLELTEYLQGDRKEFCIPMEVQGTPFQEKVWKALVEIPFGQTTTYSEIAKQINQPKAVRAIGAAIGKNPLLITIPCHRVIGKNGSLTGYRGGLDMKTRLLQLERSFE